MDKELIEVTEEKLKRYFKKDKKIKSTMDKIRILENQINNIEKDLKKCNVSIDPESSALNFEERVQTSPDGTSYAEREVMRITDIKLKRIREKQSKIEELKELIDTIEFDCEDIESIINDMPQYSKLLEYRYGKEWSDQKISNEVHLSQSQVNKKIRKAVIKIGEWSYWGIGYVE